MATTLRRPRLAQEHPAVKAYRRTGRYPIKGQSTRFSWDVWTCPERHRTPEAEAERVVAFINSLTIPLGHDAGRPFRLRPWQEQIVRRLFGTLDADGYRQYRTVYACLPRKQGKSSLAGAMMLYLLMGDGEPGAELISAAADADQAALVFKLAARMVSNDPDLAARLEVVPSRRMIHHRASGSLYRVIAADAATAHGLDLHALCADELHVWPRRDLWDVLSSSTGARLTPLKLIITTAGRDEDSIGAEMHRYALAVRDGVKEDPAFLPIIYAAPPDADWLSEETWRSCNPALGDFRSLEEMRAMAREAQAIPGREPAFRQLYLNQWGAAPDNAWLNVGDWDACGTDAEALGVLAADLPCLIGIDLATSRDMSAVVSVCGPDAEGRVMVQATFWWPERAYALAARQPGAPPYREWIDAGRLILTAGDVADYDVVEQAVIALAERRWVREICVDPFGAPELVQRLMKTGLTVVSITQDAHRLNPGMQELERLVLAHRLVHDRHPVLRWNAKNVHIVSNSAGAIRPDKDKRRERIDGVSALVTALTRLHVLAPDPGSEIDARVARGEAPLVVL